MSFLFDRRCNNLSFIVEGQNMYQLIIFVMGLVSMMPAMAELPYPYHFLETPQDLITEVPSLRKAKFKAGIWTKQLTIPGMGVKKVELRYFESSLSAPEIFPGAGSFAVTLVRATKPQKGMTVVVVTQANPREATLANESINALLPRWLIEQGVDMYEVYKLPMGAYKFSWDGRQWSFDQLTELISTVVPGQILPGGYLGKSAKEEICLNNLDPQVQGHAVYALTQHLAKKTQCDVNKMHELAGQALHAFIRSAPRVK